MFIWIDNEKNITVINKKFILFFFIWITWMISIDTENDMDTEKIILILNVHY